MAVVIPDKRTSIGEVKYNYDTIKSISSIDYVWYWNITWIPLETSIFEASKKEIKVRFFHQHFIASCNSLFLSFSKLLFIFPFHNLVHLDFLVAWIWRISTKTERSLAEVQYYCIIKWWFEVRMFAIESSWHKKL